MKTLIQATLVRAVGSYYCPSPTVDTHFRPMSAYFSVLKRRRTENMKIPSGRSQHFHIPFAEATVPHVARRRRSPAATHSKPCNCEAVVCSMPCRVLVGSASVWKEAQLPFHGVRMHAASFPFEASVKSPTVRGQAGLASSPKQRRYSIEATVRNCSCCFARN